MTKLFELENRNGGIDEGTLLVSILDTIKESGAKKWIVDPYDLGERRCAGD